MQEPPSGFRLNDIPVPEVHEAYRTICVAVPDLFIYIYLSQSLSASLAERPEEPATNRSSYN
jgi:hypothetical protein